MKKIPSMKQTDKKMPSMPNNQMHRHKNNGVLNGVTSHISPHIIDYFPRHTDECQIYKCPQKRQKINRNTISKRTNISQGKSVRFSVCFLIIWRAPLYKTANYTTIFKTVIFNIKISNINNDRKPGRFDNPSHIFLFLLAVNPCLCTPQWACLCITMDGTAGHPLYSSVPEYSGLGRIRRGAVFLSPVGLLPAREDGHAVLLAQRFV